MKLGAITLPEHAIADDPALQRLASVEVDYDVSGRAVIFAQNLSGGESLQINVGLTDYQTAGQLIAMIGTVQTLDLGAQQAQVIVENVAAIPARQYDTYQPGDPFTVTIDVRKL